ncbi:hypothetical protein OIV83_006088 [Microbotryomycetes sp. JL201]|nr:hypothetical protein OIV83_006088 [Microbotryomycetes sp. JL201]
MQPSTSSPVSPHRHAPALQSMYQQVTFGQPPSGPSHANNHASSAAHVSNAAIPFSTPPGPAPGQMGFGFGLSPANSLNLRSSIGWGSTSAMPPGSATHGRTASPAPHHRAIPMMQSGSGTGPFSYSPTSSMAPDGTTSPSRLRGAHRRRRSSMDSASDNERDVTNTHRPIRGVKKARTVSTKDDERFVTMNKDVDLGKALASLSKDSLLSLLNNLVTSQPHLRQTLQALLPPPTLSDTLATLATLERNVTTAIPSGSILREEYVWGRVRLPLEEYVTEAKSFLSAFISAATAPYLNQQVHAPASEDDISHPSTTFAFLHALTASIRRLEFALPSTASLASSSLDPLSSHLLPLTVNCWHIFLTKLSTSVNEEGRMISAGMLRGWFSKMDELTVASPPFTVSVPGRPAVARPEGVARRACEGVRDRMRKEVGWLVGIRDVASVQQQMDDDEEL